MIAPARIFSPGAPYGDSMWYFLMGAVAPIPFFVIKKKWPNWWVSKWVNMPLFFSGTGMIPPATPLHYAVWSSVG
jgi:OPT oligopeptide transporter protein